MPRKNRSKRPLGRWPSSTIRTRTQIPKPGRSSRRLPMVCSKQKIVSSLEFHIFSSPFPLSLAFLIPFLFLNFFPLSLPPSIPPPFPPTAYEVLSDKDKRRQYDMFGPQQGAGGGPRHSSNFDYNTFYSHSHRNDHHKQSGFHHTFDFNFDDIFKEFFDEEDDLFFGFPRPSFGNKHSSGSNGKDNSRGRRKS